MDGKLIEEARRKMKQRRLSSYKLPDKGAVNKARNNLLEKRILSQVDKLLPNDYVSKEDFLKAFDALIRQPMPEPQKVDVSRFVDRSELEGLIPSTEGFLTKSEFNKFLNKLDRILGGIHSGGGGNYQDLLARVKDLERLQKPFTADNTKQTVDSTKRTADEI